MRVRAVGVSLMLGMLGASAPHAQTEEAERVATANRVVAEIMGASDSAIPASVFDNADAVAIFPSTYKAGFIFGGHRGRGVISVRDDGTQT